MEASRRSQPVAQLRLVSKDGTCTRCLAEKHPDGNCKAGDGPGGTAHPSGASLSRRPRNRTRLETRCSNVFRSSCSPRARGPRYSAPPSPSGPAREVLRRAQALTLFVRFAPRQRQRPMNELLSGSGSNLELDPVGSLIDADMAAYYQWINQQRLPRSEQSSFLVWFEGHNQALAISPSLPRGTESSSTIDLGQLLSLATG